MLAGSSTEPLVLADGRKIDPATGKVMRESKFIEVPAPTEAQKIVMRTKRTLNELPLPPKQMSTVGIVAFYTLFGLRDEDIAIATGLTVTQIENIRTLDPYKDFMRETRTNILKQEEEDVRELFAQHARSAAHKVVELATTGEGVLAFKAAQDVLDRAGHRPVDVVQHKHEMSNALQIVVINRDETQQIPAIDADYSVVSD